MGGSLGLALREAGWSVGGLDRDPAVAERALARGAVEAVAGNLAGAELVVLAVPVLAAHDLLWQLAREAPGALVTDLCSTKVEVLRWAEEVGVDLVGGHPLCGSEESGIDAARADLYAGATWALSRSHPQVEAMVAAAGGRPLLVDPAEHDRLVAGTSHAAFTISAAYMLAASGAADWPAMAPLAARGFRDMTRLAAGDPGMYAGIAATNAANLRARLLEFQAALARLLDGLGGPPEELAALFAQARDARVEWDEHG